MDLGSNYVWHVWKRRVFDYGFRMLRRDDLPECGFASVYAVDEQTADVLMRTQDFSGFRGVVHSETLWIDCDTEEASDLVERGLRSFGLGFEKWSTGNRGAHFGIPRMTEPSQLLPSMDRAWVKARFPEADLKLYSHLHMFRRPGNPHEKTGSRKTLIERVEGPGIDFREQRNVSESSPAITAAPLIEGSIFDDPVVMQWTTPQTNGSRNKALSTIAYRMASRGETPEFAMRWLQHVNALFLEPKDQGELDHIIRYAYRGRE
jgi:hypothetical protein